MIETPLTRPDLTLPSQEAAVLADAYAKAGVILEYGSGGSTILAAERCKLTFSVESDAGWLSYMQLWFAQNPTLGVVHLHHANIGPTREWGHPAESKSFRQWPDYALSVWGLDGFVHPDVVLIDGRFRTACFLTCLFRSTKPMTVLWDDYTSRTDYHRVETLVKPVDIVGRMAVFEISPMPLPVDKLAWIIGAYLRPN